MGVHRSVSELSQWEYQRLIGRVRRRRYVRRALALCGVALAVAVLVW